METNIKTYKCSICNKQHKGIPLCYGTFAPESYLQMPESERQKRCKLNSDLCEIDNYFFSKKATFFIKGRIILPIKKNKEQFVWGVWVSVSKKSYQKIKKIWHKKGREKEPPYFGWLQTVLPFYSNTLNLKTHVHTQPLGLKPEIKLEQTDHPLAIEQKEGIKLSKIQKIAESILHKKIKI